MSRSFLGLGMIISIGLVCFLLIDACYPMIDASRLKKFSQLVVDKNGRPLRAFADRQGVWRYPTQYSQVSANYIDALVNYEDRSFWHHSGINPFSLMRAVKQLLTNGRAISGGSTITMQVARILQPHSKTIPGKLWQMFRAYQLEFHLSKIEILNLYLNYAPFGGPIEGIEAATYTYLGKSAKELTNAEAALMAVLPQSPSRYRPDRFPQRAEKARNKVLDRLNQYHVWSAESIKQAKQELVVAEFNSRPLIAPLLARRLAKRYPEQSVITSTIDRDIQRRVADQVKTYLQRFSSSTSASALLLDNQTLATLAYVGAGDFANKKRFGHVDMNQAIRSPGSTLKPFIYAMAIDQQLIHSQSLLQDVPLDFGNYSPKNFTRRFSGPVSVTNALQQSLNIPAVQTLSHLGVANFAAQLENAGLKLHFLNHSKASLSLALGGVGVKLEQLVGIYRSLAANGRAGKPRYLKSSSLQESYLVSPSSAWIVGDILSKVPLISPHTKLFYRGTTQMSNQWLAHKTGTSYGYRDAWMIAVSNRYTLAVWIGKPDGSPSPGEYGRKTAAPLVRAIFAGLPERQSKQPKRPAKVVSGEICWPLGTLRQSQTEAQCLVKKKAWLIDDVAPQTLLESGGLGTNLLSINIDPSTGRRVFAACFNQPSIKKEIAIWPSRVDLWLAKKWRFSQLVAKMHPDCEGKIDINPRLAIIGINNNARISPSPNATQGFSINLKVTGGYGEITWLNNGLLIGHSAPGEPLLLSKIDKGQQRLTVFDQNGNSGELSFELL